MAQEKQEKLLSPGQVAKALGVSSITLRRMCDRFNIETERTQVEKGEGHRRFSKENIDDLKKINEMLHVQNLSWDLAVDIWNGDTKIVPKTELVSDEEINVMYLKNRLDEQEKAVKAMYEKFSEMVEELGKEREERLRLESEKKELQLKLEQKSDEVVPEKKSWWKIKLFG